jgi:drug/metabolite transporter (DMT)-like permease
MIYLLLSISGNALLFIILKYFERFRVHTLQAIVVNYFTALTLGLLHNHSASGIRDIPHLPGLGIAFILGTLFIIIFLLLAKTAQEIGVSVATVANKMSVVIPVCIAILFYHNSFGILKVTGIVLALVAVVLTSKKESNPGTIPARGLILLPLVVFIGSGAIDALLNYSQEKIVAHADSSLFIATCFAVAAGIGLSTLLIRGVIRGEKFEYKSLIGGILLGIPNYYSTYYLLEALHSKTMESSVLYPLNNLGIVVLCAVAAYLLFREKLSAFNLAGIFLSLIAIVLIAFS